ncbi:hypothetical protein [Algoriphagus sp.]|uniref:hypothetical protein n=1 Tax=Algoriphagus sp. TaxID=1872435 RepID=UPI003288ECDC
MEGFRELFQRSDASGSRSTILKPLTWFLSAIIGGFLLAIKMESHSWILVLFAIIIVMTISIFFFAYIYCLFKDRDALRSEKYSIQKMAIEKGLVGDNLTGLITQDESSKISKKNLSKESEKGN